MITYTWDFPRLSAHPSLNGLSNVVHNVEFILTATDGEGHGSQIFGTVGISEPSNPDDFKPFNLLTHNVVEQWVIDALGQEALDDHKANLANQIEQQKTPASVVLNKPW